METLMKRVGFSLLEMILILILIGIVVTFCVPNFMYLNENALAQNAKNNLYAIYTAQKNYFNENNTYCVGPCSTIAFINQFLSLNIVDDGTYIYYCQGAANDADCVASRSNLQKPPGTVGHGFSLEINMSAPIGPNNPSCTFIDSQSQTWCPHFS
jgi:type II secretory pathway pseudopilin PulG